MANKVSRPASLNWPCISLELLGVRQNARKTYHQHPIYIYIYVNIRLSMVAWELIATNRYIRLETILMLLSTKGDGLAQWLDRWTGNPKVEGWNPVRSTRQILRFSESQRLCGLAVGVKKNQQRDYLATHNTYIGYWFWHTYTHARTQTQTQT